MNSYYSIGLAEITNCNIEVMVFNIILVWNYAYVVASLIIEVDILMEYKSVVSSGCILSGRYNKVVTLIWWPLSEVSLYPYVAINGCSHV